MVYIMHEQNIIYSKTNLDSTLHMSRQLFVGSYLQVDHMMGSQQVERKKNALNDIIIYFDWCLELMTAQ